MASSGREHDSRINTGRPHTASEGDSRRNKSLDDQQHYPNEIEERNAAQERLNDSGTGHEPAHIQEEIAVADKRARKGGRHDEVRDTPPFGDWDTTGPVSPDPHSDGGDNQVIDTEH
jgi:hypothetical protein